MNYCGMNVAMKSSYIYITDSRGSVDDCNIYLQSPANVREIGEMREAREG